MNAQRDVNIDELMNNMLSHSTGTPTQQKFLDLLIANKLTQKDFIHPVIRVNGLDRDVFPTQAMFGKSIIDLHKTVIPHTESASLLLSFAIFPFFFLSHSCFFPCLYPFCV